MGITLDEKKLDQLFEATFEKLSLILDAGKAKIEQDLDEALLSLKETTKNALEAGKVICKVIQKAAPVLKAFAPVVRGLSRFLPPQFQAACVIASIAMLTVAHIAEIIPEELTMEDFGERILQGEAQGITLASCNDDFDEYISQLMELELDAEKMHSKVEQSIAVMCIVERGLEFKKPELAMINLVPYIMDHPEAFDEKHLRAYLEQAQKEGLDFAPILEVYFDKSAPADKRFEAGEFMEKVEENLENAS